MKKYTIYAGFRRLFSNEWYMRLIHFFAGFGVAGWLFCSCSPIERHARLVRKFPFVHTQDTVVLKDTIRVQIPKIQVDTVVLISELKDTITIEKDRLKVKLWTVHDSIFVKGISDTITVNKEVIRKVPIRYYVSKVERTWLKFVILLAVVGFALYAVFRKRDNDSKTTININKNESDVDLDSESSK